jgi:hypothetical protein
MTSRGMIALLARRWYLLLLGAALTMAGTYVTIQRPGVYWTGYNVVVLAPTEKYYDNQLVDAHHDMARVAGVFVREYNGTHPGLLTASSDTRLYGEGERSAVQVRMANQGSQWKPLYPVPVIDVEVVDSSPELVASRAQATLQQVDAIVRRYQDQAGVAPGWRIVALTSPTDPGISYHNGSRARAAAASGVLGVSLTLVGIWSVDQLLARRRRRTPAAPTAEPAPEAAREVAW